MKKLLRLSTILIFSFFRTSIYATTNEKNKDYIVSKIQETSIILTKSKEKTQLSNTTSKYIEDPDAYIIRIRNSWNTH